MADETPVTTTPSESATKVPKKAAKKAAKKGPSQGVTAVFSSVATPIQSMSVEDLDREIKQLELEIKRNQLLTSQEENQKVVHSRAEKKRKAESAQRALRAEKFGRDQTAAQCVHQLGGYGNDDTFNGDDKPSIVITDLPIPGQRLVMCVRCPKEWRTPDPSIKKSNPALWAEQAAEWKEALQLIKKSRAKAMGGPTFGFETPDGNPIHPTLV